MRTGTSSISDRSNPHTISSYVGQSNEEAAKKLFYIHNMAT